MSTSSIAPLLIVAGHDPSGAGIDADLDTLRELGLEAHAIVTARTEQDERGVRAIGARSARAWLREGFACVLQPISALKFGLLPGSDHMTAARDLARSFLDRHGRDFPIVVDPVISSSSGSRFLDRDGVRALRNELLVEPLIATPNLDELAELSGVELRTLVRSLDARLRAARELVAAGAAAVIVKGGHGEEDPVRDLLVRRDGRFHWHVHPRVPGGKIRGSGCRFASRLAARLAQGQELEAAMEDAGTHLADRISAATRSRSSRPLP